MKLFTRIAALLLAAFGITQIVAQTTQPQGSLLYEISRKDIAKPSYVFGTIHAICPADMISIDGLTPYVDKTDQMMMEIDMDDPAEMGSMMQVATIPGGRSFKDFLTPEQFKKVDEMTTNYLGYSAEMVKNIKPTLLSVMLIASPKAIGCSPSAYDLALMKEALAKKKPIVGLETVAMQIKVLDSKPLDVQAKELYTMSLDPQKSIAEFKALTEVYKLHDAEKLFERSVSTTSGDRDFQVKLLDERNTAWVPKIETAIKEKPNFIAVGAAHLGGKVGLISLLRAKGYTVTPIKLSRPAAGDN